MRKRYTAVASSTETDQDQFVEQLVHLIGDIPVEDGIKHPAEDLMTVELRRRGPAAGTWIRAAYDRNAATRPGIAADILRCIRGLGPVTAMPWGLPLVERGLAHDDVEVRDAAASVLEHWGGDDALRLLRRQASREKVPWLAAYMHGVIDDLAQSHI
jgi:hypothetical protein